MKGSTKRSLYDRPKQETPAEILNDLLRVIRGQFCPDLSDNDWYPHVRFLKRVLTYGAAWLNKRAVALPPQRYQAIYQDIFRGIKTSGKTDSVRYWPGYLLHCVQQHFKHHGEDYYEEGKSIRALAERAMMACTRSQTAHVAPDPMAAYSQAHAILARPKRRQKRAEKQPFLDL